MKPCFPVPPIYRCFRVHKATGAITGRYETVKQAALANDRNVCSMYKTVHESKIAKGSYVFIESAKWNGVYDFRRCRVNRPLFAVKDKQALWFPGIEYAAKSLGVCKSTIWKALGSNNYIKCLKMTVRYANTTNDVHILRNAGYEVEIHDL